MDIAGSRRKSSTIRVYTRASQAGRQAASLPTMAPTITQICRYPVKGMSGSPLPSIDLQAGKSIAHDRRFALAHASSGVNHSLPEWMPKNHFLNLSRDEKIAQLSVNFDATANKLTIERGGRQVASGNPATPLGRMMLDQFFAGFVPAGARGNPKLIEAHDTPFADCADPFLSIVNLASVGDIERVARCAVDPTRFRANIYIEDAERWEERDWLGKEISIGTARLRIEEPIERCAATNVDPATATRDMNIPLLLERGFGHVECGVYARVIDAGTISAGDQIEFIR